MPNKNSKKPRVEVRRQGGKAFITTQAFYDNPTLVRDTVLPKYGKLYVTRFGKVAFVVEMPDLEDLGVEVDTF